MHLRVGNRLSHFIGKKGLLPENILSEQSGRKLSEKAAGHFRDEDHGHLTAFRLHGAKFAENAPGRDFSNLLQRFQLVPEARTGKPTVGLLAAAVLATGVVVLHDERHADAVDGFADPFEKTVAVRINCV